MISFYPGPSRTLDEIPKWVKEAHKLGILSMSHRGKEFSKLSKKTITLLKQKLNIPEDYTVFFTSSATECWEIIAQSMVVSKSIHLHNGAFGEKWFNYTRRLKPDAQSIPFDLENELVPGNLIFKDGEIICLTQNETSNGTQVSNVIIDAIKKNNPEHLLAVDATSSMAGIQLNFNSADIWFASVQKCFGLPAGLAVMICSPRAIMHIEKVHERNHYNSLSFMYEMMNKWQTPCTPNVLGIFLLMRALKAKSKIKATDRKTNRRHKEWIRFFKRSGNLHLMIQNPSVMSQTVIAVKGIPEHIEKVKAAARKKGILLGEGYGSLKKETFRIANFPALRKKEIERLMDFLMPFK